MLIDFVLPPSVATSRNYAAEPPLGLLSIMSAKPSHLKVDVRLLDSTLIDEHEILARMEEKAPDVVAISCNTYNYRNGLKLAEHAKKAGAIVVMGGIHVTRVSDSILARMRAGSRPIDYLIIGEGEVGFWQLVSAFLGEGGLAKVRGLSYVDKAGLIRKNAPATPPETAGAERPLDYRLVDVAAYSRQFRTFGNISKATSVSSMFTQRGCPQGGRTRCDFCSISRNLSTRCADIVSKDFRSLAVEHGCDHIRIIDPQLTPSKRYLDTVGEAINRVREEEGVNPTFYCFMRADAAVPNRIAALKRLNVVSVFVGYDSGSDRMLKAMNKRTTAAQNIEATKRLADAGIDVLCCGLVLGAEGEDERSLGETVEFVQALSDVGNVRSTLATPLTPLPGSDSWERLVARLVAIGDSDASRLEGEDIFDVEWAMRLWNRHMATIPMVRLREAEKAISEIVPIEIVF